MRTPFSLVRRPLAALGLAVPMLAGCRTVSPGAPIVAGSRALALDRVLVAEARRLGLLDTAEGKGRLAERRQALLRDVMEERLLKAGPEVTPEEVEAEYQRHREKFLGGERLQLRHIFRRVSAQATPEERARARAEMEGLRAQIAAGADMAALARERSDSQTARFDGMLKPLARGQLDPSVDAVVWALQRGELSGVVDTPVGLHVFRLEERLAPPPLDEDTARGVVRQRLRLAARKRARDDAFAELVRASGARIRSHVARDAPDAETAFERPGRRLTVGDLRALQRGLPFVAQRTRSLDELLHEEAWRDLLVWRAEQEGLAREPAVATRLADVEPALLREVAWARRLELRRERLTDEDLQPYLDQGVTAPAMHRLRVVVVVFKPDHTPHHAFEQADAVARDVHAGRRDLAEAARAMSDDPSAAEGGDLGFVLLRDVGWWAGITTYEKVKALPPGELGGPWLVEVYDEPQLSYEPRAYALFRVEEVRPGRPLVGREARARAASDWMAARAAEVGTEVAEEVLREAGAVLVP